MIAVVGDVHGEIVSLKELYYKLMDKYFIHRFVFLGDIIAKGNYSKEVVDYLIEMQGKILVTFIKGNHEQLLIDYMDKTNEPDYDWASRIGHTVTASFMGISREEALTKSREEVEAAIKPYLSFFKSFRDLYIENTTKHKFIFSHEDTPFFEDTPNELLKICIEDELNRQNKHASNDALDKFVEKIDTKISEFIIVHGHSALVDKESTPEELQNVEPKIMQDDTGKILSINLDTGCTYGGKLTAMIIDETGNFVFESVQCDT